MEHKESVFKKLKRKDFNQIIKIDIMVSYTLIVKRKQKKQKNKWINKLF